MPRAPPSMINGGEGRVKERTEEKRGEYAHFRAPGECPTLTIGMR
jgi:hypothetical protein